LLCQSYFAVNEMSPDDGRKRAYRREMLLASALIVAGVVLTGFSIVQIRAQSSQLAQATQPLQSSPPTAPNNTPAESKPGGERPTTPAPEPARPDAQAQKEGEKPALPAAPAEKMAAPIQQK
jgi:hypothetical protein